MSIRARTFTATRSHHRREAAEDYTELVMDLIERGGEARTCTIAEHLGISHVTAIRTIRRLQHEGYLITGRHRPVLLTRKGRRTALLAKARHKLLVDLFIELGVPRAVAETDAEGAEHHISPATIRHIRRFLERRNRQND